MRNRQRKKSVSMRGTILKSTLGISIGSLIVLVLMMTIMEMIPSLDKSAYNSMRTQCESRSAQLGSQLNLLATSSWTLREQFQENTMNILDKQALKPSDLQGNQELLNEILSSSFQFMEQFLNEKSVTGVFIILDAGYTDNGHASLYIRDGSPGVRTKSNADFMLLRGPGSLPEVKNMALEKSWSFEHPLAAENSDVSNDLFEKPYHAFLDTPNTDYRNWGYWSELCRFKPEDVPIITYSIPMLSEDGEFLGVAGFELSKQYISTMLPEGDLPYEDGFFMYGAVKNNEINVNTVISPETKANLFLLNYSDTIAFNGVRGYKEMFTFQHGNEDMIITYTSLDLHGINSLFKDENSYLMAIAPKAQILSTSYDITFILVITLCLTLAVSLVGGIILSKFVSSRIERLAKEVRSIESNKPIHLMRTDIEEIDELSATLEHMSVTLIKNAARMSTIVDLVGIPLGAFEITLHSKRVFLTESLFRLLDLPHTKEDSQYLTFEEWEVYLPSIESMISDAELMKIFPWKFGSGETKWMRMRYTIDNDNIYGTLIDITDEVQEKERLKYERDYDPLTKLLNRNAYSSRIKESISTAPEQFGAMLFIDLDNLKTLNDTFGHDIGDRYIQLAAQSFKAFEDAGAVVARIAGDEFVIYLHGYKDLNLLKKKVEGYLHMSRQHNMLLPDATIQKVRMSAGISYYPCDSESIDNLIRYADFAMYEIKHSAKGGTYEFDKISYERNGFLLNKASILDEFIDQGRMRFAFQPIVDAKTGYIFGYEALMRPAMRELHSPGEVIALARSQSKLYQLEKLVLNNIFEWVAANIDNIGNRHIFFNSLPNQMLKREDIRDSLVSDAVANIHMVMEVTEEEYSTASFLETKVKEARDMGFSIALDDYGSGYSNELTLLTIQPDYIKIDMALIRNIHKDPTRQALIRNILEFTKNTNVKVIAEGVETKEELETLIQMGVDYLQGFYFSQPQFLLIGSIHENLSCELLDLNRRAAHMM